MITQVSVGGIVLSGYYQVVTSVSSTQYTVTAASAATATVTNGGAVPSFTTMTGLATVTVGLDNHGLTAGVSSFPIAVATAVGGITLSGVYVVQTVVDANNFTISAASAATRMRRLPRTGGMPQIQYLLPTGYAVDTPLMGYGVGDYGEGDYGYAGSGQTIAPLRQWSLDHWGISLIANPSNLGIYYWTPPPLSRPWSFPTLLHSTIRQSSLSHKRGLSWRSVQRRVVFSNHS